MNGETTLYFTTPAVPVAGAVTGTVNSLNLTPKQNKTPNPQN